jgi:hypothetical protein
MNLQRLIELDDMLDDVITMRGERLAEELQFANTTESSRSVARDIGMLGGGAAIGGSLVGLLTRGRRSGGAAKALSPRAQKKAQNKRDHKNDQRRAKGKRRFDRATAQKEKGYN